MPIEDVDFLKQNSIKQSYIFLVNSADRDRNAYPTPSEYVVEFTTPFQNVVGLQVLNASIPRTMYNVDVRNNTIRFLIHSPDVSTATLQDTSRYVTRRLTVGDYSIQTLLEELNNVLRMPLDNNSSNETISITVETTTNSPDVQNLLRFHCPYPFAFDMKGSTVAEVLGFDLYVDGNEAAKDAEERRFQPIPVAASDPNYKIYHSVDLPPALKLGKERIVFEGPRGVVRKTLLTGSLAAQSFTITSPGYFTKIFAALTTPDGIIAANSIVTWELRQDLGGSPADEPIPLTSEVGGDAITGYIPVSFVDGGFSDQDDPVAVYLEKGTYWVVLTATYEDVDVYAYFNDVSSERRRGDFKIWDGDAWVSQDTDTGIHFELSVRMVMQDKYHALVAPGIYSLIGERYIVMRCPEIEENSYRSLAYGKHCLGLAKFQLGVIGYSENRLDFSSIPLREFHPIGKLSRMTLRFVTASGELYDFKGINHDITFAIHYYEPIQKQKFEQSILNPNYSGNVMQYLANRDALEYESDDQEYDYNEDDLSEYRRQEARHLPENVRRLDLEALHRIDLYDDEESGGDAP